jgi:hypothetical protein
MTATHQSLALGHSTQIPSIVSGFLTTNQNKPTHDPNEEPNWNLKGIMTLIKLVNAKCYNAAELAFQLSEFWPDQVTPETSTAAVKSLCDRMGLQIEVIHKLKVRVPGMPTEQERKREARRKAAMAAIQRPLPSYETTEEPTYSGGSAEGGPWSDRAIETMRQLAQAKTHTAIQIAEHLAMQWPECFILMTKRGAVLGKCNRLEIPLEAGLRSKPSNSASRPYKRNRKKANTSLRSYNGSRQKRQRSSSIRVATLADSTPENAPGQIKRTGKLSIRDASAILTEYHQAMISATPDTKPQAPECLKEFWPVPEPRHESGENHNLCQYITVTDNNKRRSYFCGCPSVGGKSYCEGHQNLCTI